MTDDMRAAEQRILDNLRGPFIESSQDKLRQLRAAIKSPGALSNLEQVQFFLSEIHALKGMGGTFGFQNFTQIAARLELYLDGVTDVTQGQMEDLSVFLECLDDCLVSGTHLPQNEIDRQLSKLPNP